MSIDFENGLLVGLAIAYKKAAVAMAIGGGLIAAVADALLLRELAASDAAAASLPSDARPAAADNTTLPPMGISDAVSATLR